jgi:hypothetical protein
MRRFDPMRFVGITIVWFVACASSVGIVLALALALCAGLAWATAKGKGYVR